ncbi:glycosyltransferase family 2 protein [Flavobacterium sp. TMP13]|uniref:glycosyltransferase family 2 protein n=1 Tax=Flavobacterium sp. TMP13 TaxID=3425950 RepID=UPI003D7722CA
MTFFSVIVPLYNKAAYIENTLKSVLNQTFKDYEIIVINDESTDESKTKVLEFNDEKIQLYTQKNQGVSVARNLGIEKSQGKLIAFLDADDFWFPNHLQELADLYHNFPNSGMYCSRYKIKTTKHHFQFPYFNGIENSYRGIIDNYFFSNFPYRISWTSSLAIPKKTLEKIGAFTPGVTNGQDLELWTKIGINYPVAITNKITAIYHFDIPNSLAKNKIGLMKLMDFEQFEIAEQHDSNLKKNLDQYRIEYGLRYHIFGYTDKANFYIKDIDLKKSYFKIWALFQIPPFCLRILFNFKNYIKKIGIDFSIYD